MRLPWLRPALAAGSSQRSLYCSLSREQARRWPPGASDSPTTGNALEHPNQDPLFVPFVAFCSNPAFKRATQNSPMIAASVNIEVITLITIEPEAIASSPFISSAIV
jgi:hypothetical protein